MLRQSVATVDAPGEPLPGPHVWGPLDPARCAMRRVALPSGLRIAATWRGGVGVPLLFLPANRTNRRIYDFVLAGLSIANPILVPDLRGLGDSDAPPNGYRLRDHIEDLCALVDAVGLERFAVVGQATGATLALILATRLPERVLAVAAGDVAVSLRRDVFDLFLQQVEAHDRGFASTDDALAATPFREPWPDDVAQHWLDTALARSADGRWRWRYFRPGIVETQADLCNDHWPDIRIRQPTLLFHGENCTVIGQDAMVRARAEIPHANFAVLKGANHRLTQDNPAGFAALIEGFLRTERLA